MNTFFVDQQQTPVFNAFEDIGNFVVFQQDLTTGEIRTNSAQYTKLFGFEPDIQLVFSKSCTSKLSRYYENILLTYKDQLLNGTKSEFTIDYPIKSDQTTRWFRTIIKVVAWENNTKPLAIIGLHRNITAEHHKDEQLKELATNYNTITSVGKDIIVQFDKTGRILFANRHFHDFFETNHETNKDLRIVNFMDSAAMRLFSEWLAQINVHSKTFSQNSKYKINHSEKTLLWEYTPVQDIEGKIIYINAHISDVTQVQNLYEEINKRKQIEHKLLSQMGIGAWEYDISNQDLELSEVASQLSGIHSLDDVKIWFSTLNQKSKQQLNEIWDNLINNRTTKFSIVINQQNIGKINLTGVLTNTANGLSNKIIGAITPLNDIEESYFQILNEKQNYERNYNFVRTFLSEISFKVRTPLNSILGFSELLSENDTSENEIDRFNKIIFKNAQILLDFMNHILEVSDIRNDQLNNLPVTFDLNTVLKEIVDGFQPDINSKSAFINISGHLAKSELYIKTDKEVFEDIVKKTIQCVSSIHRTQSVSLNARQSDSKLHLSFECIGENIINEFPIELFANFETIKTDLAKVKHDKQMLTPSNWLNFYMCKSYIEILNGEFLIFENSNSVSVEVTIPVEFNYLIKQSHPKIKEKAKILLIEDNDTNQLLINEILKKMGFEITICGTGMQGIEAFQKNPDFDLILMDIKLPDIDGYEVTKRIKILNRNIPIIAQTAFALAGDRANAIAAGCDDYISKPISKQRLQEMVTKYVSIEPK